jgi:hypothetical protein
MTTTTPIPTSIADACAAHDRHRLDVLDALLDEAAPTAVRELLGAALDLCATLRAERDEREAAIGATFAKHRAEIDAATGQLAAARQVIDEERATVARLTADYMTVVDAIMPNSDGPTHAAATARSRRRHIAELEAEIRVSDQRLADQHDTWKARVASLESERSEWIAAAVDVGAALGGSLGPVASTSGTIDPREWIRYAQGLARDVRKMTARVAELPAQDRAKELYRAWKQVRDAAEERIGELTIAEAIVAMRSALTSLGAPATTPTAAPGLVAAVSVEELREERLRAVKGCNHSDSDDNGHGHGECCGRAGIRAILARLDATTIAPVDPREFARVLIMRDLTDDDGDISTTAVAAAARYALTAAGIPVTPEAGK